MKVTRLMALPLLLVGLSTLTVACDTATEPEVTEPIEGEQMDEAPMEGEAMEEPAEVEGSE
ncbi:MAG: hypothetical protein WBA99_16555 [Nodosilinea sp.]